MFIVYIESSFQHWVLFSLHPIPQIHTHNTFCYSIIEPHHPLIFYLFFYFSNFSSHYYLQKNKNKNFFFSLLRLHFLQTFLSIFVSLPPPTSLYFITLPSSFFITWLFFIPFCLYTFMVTLPPTFLFPHCLFTSLLFTLLLHFIIFYSLFYNLTLLLPILFV